MMFKDLIVIKLLPFFLVFLLTFSFGLAIHANCTSTANGVIILDSNVNKTPGTCFTITSNNTLIDCQGFSINYTGYSVNTNGFSNVTVKNCVINGNNSPSSGWGVWMDTGGFNNLILNNTIVTNSPGGGGIYVSLQTGANISSNTIVTYNEQSPGIRFQDSNSSTIFSNSITTNNSRTGPTGSYGFYLVGNTHDNLLKNNTVNFLAMFNYSIYDLTSGDYYNYFSYSTSKGEINWMNNGTGSFLRNLSLLDSGGLGLNKNIIIDSNIVAVNTSGFTDGRINSSANITLYSLSGDTVSSITKDHAFRLTAATVSGFDCLTSSPVSCYQKSFSGGTLIFNVTGWSSFTSVTTSSSSGSVPEFEDYAMMFILVISISGFFVMKRKQEG